MIELPKPGEVWTTGFGEYVVEYMARDQRTNEYVVVAKKNGAPESVHVWPLNHGDAGWWQLFRRVSPCSA